MIPPVELEDTYHHNHPAPAPADTAHAGLSQTRGDSESPAGGQRDPVNGILWKLRTGAPWRDVPERYGPWKTGHERLRIWTMDGTWAKILDEAVVKDDAAGEVEWVFSVDSTSIRAHQHAAGARKKGAAPIRSRPSLWPENASDGPAGDYLGCP